MRSTDVGEIGKWTIPSFRKSMWLIFIHILLGSCWLVNLFGLVLQCIVRLWNRQGSFRNLLLTRFHTQQSWIILGCIRIYLLRSLAPSQSFESSLWTYDHTQLQNCLWKHCFFLDKYIGPIHLIHRYRIQKNIDIYIYIQYIYRTIYTNIGENINIVEAERSNNGHLAGWEQNDQRDR